MQNPVLAAFTALYAFLTSNLPLAIRVTLCDHVETIELYVKGQTLTIEQQRNTIENVCQERAHAYQDIKDLNDECEALALGNKRERNTVQQLLTRNVEQAARIRTLQGCLAKGESERRDAAESHDEMQAGLVEELDATSDELQDMKHERDHYRAQLAWVRASLADVQRDAQPGATVKVGPSTFSKLTYKQQCSK